MKLISPTQYVEQASEAMQKATKRIYLLSLVIADHPKTHSLIVELEAAAKRGVEVVVMADIFTFGEVSGGFLPIRYYSTGARDTNRMVRRLKHAGVKFTWLGRARLTLFNGRTHTKWCIIDDTIFTFGGVNLFDGGIENVDFMFRLDNARLSDRLVDEQKRLQEAERRSTNFPSVEYEHGEETVLIDGGIIGQSVIYRRACELAEQAASIVFVSQYCPTGKLARILKKRQTSLYYNRVSQALGLNKLTIAVNQFVSGLKTLYEKDTYLHSKFIIFTMKDGSKRAITGSHNFAYIGVLLGTREIALETSNPNIINQLETFLQDEVIGFKPYIEN